jgi:proline iminopeptidase
MRSLRLLWLLLLCPTLAHAAPSPLRDGERREPLNGVVQWWRVAGARRATVPLVVLHGGPGGNHWNFERSAGAQLEKSTTVVYWEQRGCGRSEAPEDPNAYSIPLLVADLEALRERLGVPRIDVLGYSFGATLAAEYALAHPERVRRVVLQAPAELHSEALAWVQLQGFLAVSSGPVREQVQKLLVGEGSAQQRLERVWSAVDTQTVDRFLFESQERARWNREGWKASGLKNTGLMAKALLREPRPALLPRAASLHAPTLVLIGLHDRNVGVDFARNLADVLPAGQLSVLQRSAHFPDLEEPARWAQVVRGFLRAR